MERNILFQTDAFEIVSITWTKGSESPIHDHGWSQCLVLVEEGEFENTLDLGMQREVQKFLKGNVLGTPVGAKHEIKCLSQFGKTLHVYTPKLTDTDRPLHFSPVNSDFFKSHVDLSKAVTINELTDILRSFKDLSISTHSPYFMNQLFSGVLPQMLMGEEFVAQTRTTLATYEASPILSSIEAEIVEKLGEVIGWSKGERSGVSVPGGSAANFMAIHCARQMKFPDSRQKGIGNRNYKVFVSSEAHYSFKKACAVLGIGTQNLVLVPSDDRGRMRIDQLDDLINKHKSNGDIPLCVGATAGTTVLGAFDDIFELSHICKKHDVWLHVDGAWGGPVIFSKKLRYLVNGIELADSMTFDAHKLLGANLTSSFFLTKHTDILLQANHIGGDDYLFHADDPKLDRGKISWQCGRSSDSMSFWTIWKNIGTEGIGNFIDRLVGIRDEILPWIDKQDRLELIAEPDYLNICVRVLPPKKEENPGWSKIVRERMKTKDLAIVNYSTNENGTFLRLILAHPFLTFHHVKQILEWALEEKQEEK